LIDRRRPEGIFINPFERGEIGADLFRAACQMRLEGLVSKRRDRPYRAGRSKHWIKVKNRKHPALERVMDFLYTIFGLRRFVCSQVLRRAAWHTCGRQNCPANHVS
jgi:bifunctional non-homologous end joining protein LigD